MLEIQTRKTLQSKIKVCKSDVKIGDCANSLRLSQGRMQDFSGGGGPILKFLGFLIYMPQAAKLRAFARGVWGHAPQENFKKWCNFVRFEGYFQHFHGKKSSQKIINKHEFFH